MCVHIHVEDKFHLNIGSAVRIGVEVGCWGVCRDVVDIVAMDVVAYM